MFKDRPVVDLDYLNQRRPYEIKVVEANRGLDDKLAKQRYEELKQFDREYKLAHCRAIDVEILSYCKIHKTTFRQVCFRFNFDEYFMTKVVSGLISVNKRFAESVISKLKGAEVYDY